MIEGVDSDPKGATDAGARDEAVRLCCRRLAIVGHYGWCLLADAHEGACSGAVTSHPIPKNNFTKGKR